MFDSPISSPLCTFHLAVHFAAITTNFYAYEMASRFHGPPTAKDQVWLDMRVSESDHRRAFGLSCCRWNGLQKTWRLPIVGRIAANGQGDSVLFG